MTENKIYFLRASYSTSLLLLIWSWLKHLGTWVWISISTAKFLSISGPILSQVLDLVWRCFSNSNHSVGGHWLCKSSEISLTCNPSSTYRHLTPQLIYLHSPTNSSQQLNPSAGVRRFSNSYHSARGHGLCKSSDFSVTCNPSNIYRQLTPQLNYLHSPINTSHQLIPQAEVTLLKPSAKSSEAKHSWCQGRKPEHENSTNITRSKI